MNDAAAIGALAAFAAGIVSFLSPCVLPLVPAYVSYVAGGSHNREQPLQLEQRLEALGMSAFFVAGFYSVFVAFGASASALGQLLLRYRYEANLVAGAVVVLFGLFMLGLWRWLPWLLRDLRFSPPRGAGPVAAFLLGVAFAFGWTPCIGPVLGAILALTAAGAADGVGLLGAYALGLGVPFLLSALFVDRAAGALRRLRGVGVAIQYGGGLVLVGLGVAMLTGQLSVFANWLLDAVPALGQLG